MTSPSLHVSTPTLADIKVNNNPDSPSAGAYPPTPLTPHSTNSATTSRVDLASSSLPGNSGIHPDAAVDMTNSGKVIAGHSAAERTYAPHDRTATLSNPSDMPSPDRTEQPGPNTADDQAPSGGTHQRAAEAGTEANAVGDGIGKGIGMPGIVCMPPAILPPSPPLTVADPRDEPEGPQASTSAAPLSSFVQLSTQQPPPIQTQNLDSAPPPMREEDITNWRASMGEGMASKGDGTGNADGPREQDYPRVEVVDEDGDADFDGEYDPYDLGYSPATPEGPSATSPISHSRRETFDHPLKLEVISPSPPPWEVIQPPDSAGTVIATRRVDLGHNGPKSSTSRPLIPHSAYYFGPPPIDAAYGTEPIGHIGVHHPREIIRIERDYTGGELVQFSSTYPLELEGRITPTQFIETINTINEHLITAHSLLHSFVDNALAFFTLHLSPLVLKSHYEKEMEKLKRVIDELNSTLYNPVGLNILWPRKAAFMFLEIEYY